MVLVTTTTMAMAPAMVGVLACTVVNTMVTVTATDCYQAWVMALAMVTALATEMALLTWAKMATLLTGRKL
jgi:hypothetical protein